MSYSVINYKDPDALKDAISEFLSEYITFISSSSSGSSTDAITKYSFSVDIGAFNDKLIIIIPQAKAGTSASYFFAISFFDSLTEASKYATIMKNPNKKCVEMKNDGIDFYTIVNGDSKLIAFDSLKSSILFDKWISFDGTRTKTVMISHLPRCCGVNSAGAAKCYGDVDAIDFPKVAILSENGYACTAMPLHDTSCALLKPDISLVNNWNNNSILDSNPITTGRGNHGFSTSLYITPFTLGGYKSNSLYVVDGGASIPPHGLIQLGSYNYVRITSNIFMRVGVD